MSASDVAGDATTYPVDTFVAVWSDGEEVGHTVGFDIRLNGESGTIADTEAFLEAMGAWAWSTYEVAGGGTAGASNLNKITQDTANLYTGS